MKNLALYSVVALAATLGACSHQAPSKDTLSTIYLGKYGVELSSKDWASRGADGKVVTTLKSGVTLTKSYRSGIQDGETTYSFPYSEAIEHAETFQDGRLVAVTHYDESGLPSWQERTLPGDKREISVWHRDGSPAIVETYRHDKLITGKYFSHDQTLEASIEAGNGTRVRRDAYGELLATETFANGQMTRSIAVYPSGDPKEIETFRNGMLDGQRQTFYPGGVPKSVEEWNNGIQDGISTLFQNGEKIAEIPYVNGQKDGIEQRFRSGKLTEEITWVNDQRHGPTYLFIGEQEGTHWYYQGRQVSKSSYDRLMAR